MQHAGGFALVRYDDLQQDAEGEEPLLEWFRVPGSAAFDPAAVPTAAPVHEEPGYLLRPEPPDEVCIMPSDPLHISTHPGLNVGSTQPSAVARCIITKVLMPEACCSRSKALPGVPAK